MFAILSPNVLASESASQDPETTDNVDDASGWPWTNIDYSQSQSNTYASLSRSLASHSDFIYAHNFGFSIPSGATIDGIKFEIDKYASISGLRYIKDRHMYMVDADGVTNTSVDKADTVTKWPAGDTDTYVSYGDTDDTWGDDVLTGADVNDADFGCKFSCEFYTSVGEVIAYVDHINITVYYTSSSVPTVTTRTADTLTVDGFRSGGTSLSDGGASITSKGVRYGTSTPPGTNSASSGTGTGDYYTTLSGIGENDLYYYRAYAINSVGSGYGSILSTSTLIGAPTTSELDVSAIATDSITLTIDPDPPREAEGDSAVWYHSVSGTGGTDSTWDDFDSGYQDSGLSENSPYVYQAKFRSRAGTETSYCANDDTIYTYAVAPTNGQLDVASYGGTWILWRVVDVDNNPDAGSTDGYFDIVTDPGGGSSGLSTSDDASYYYFNDTGLTLGQEYGMRTRYDNYDGVDTTYCAEVKQTTTAAQPSITINFVGNLSDSGGPYWIPPNENASTGGPYADDGYCTNSSYQSEDEVYINCTITDATHAYLRWYDVNTSTWDNTTPLTNTGGNYWEVDTSGNISITANHKYTFRINASGSGGTNLTWWNKTGLSDVITQRYVYLGCTPNTDFTYVPLYFYQAEVETTGGTGNPYDRGQYDGGVNIPSSSSNDTGLLKFNINNEDVEALHCTQYLGLFFGDDGCAEPFTFEGAYYHIWENTTTDDGMNYYGVWMTRSKNSYTGMPSNNKHNVSSRDSSISNVTWVNDVDGSNNYGEKFYLQCGKIDLGTTYTVTDNNPYEILFISQGNVTQGTPHPIWISNRSFTSFIIPDVPDNATLNATGDGDTDDDGRSDWEELYVDYTNPFEVDTDNDGVTDYNEYLSGSDPNNYTSTQEPAVITWHSESFGGNVTVEEPLVVTWHSESFGGSVTITLGIDVELNDSSWIAGSLDCGDDVQKNFTFYQNGSATIDITLGINSTNGNYSFVNYTAWANNGHDQYCANFTIDTWSSESMVESDYPASSVLKSSFALGNFAFGIRLWMPKSVTYQDRQEDFEVVLYVSEST